MSGDVDFTSEFATTDLSGWRSEVETFINETRRELAGLIASIQASSVIDAPAVPAGDRVDEIDAHCLPRTPPRISPAVTAPTPTPSNDFDDRLSQLKRRIAEQLRSTKGASLNASR